MMTMPPTSNLPLTLSISQERPYHHSRAPKMMLRKPTHICSGAWGTMKANWAKVAMKRKMMSGLLSVTRKAVRPLCHSVPRRLLLRCIFFMGLLRKQYTPKTSSITPPKICR